MYRFPSIGVPANGPVNHHHPSIDLSVTSEFRSSPVHHPSCQHPVTSIAFLQSTSAIDIQRSAGRSRNLRARHLSHNARPAFAFLQVFPTNRCSISRWCRRSNQHLLAPTYGDAPTQCFNDHSTAEIHSPPADPSRDAVFWVIVTPVLREAPIFHRCNSRPISTETRKLLAALGYQPRTYTSLSLPSGLTEFTARCMMRDVMLRSVVDFLYLTSEVTPFEIT